MKERITKLLKTGTTLSLIVGGGVGLVSYLQGKDLIIRAVSDILFTLFLVLTIIASFLSIKDKFTLDFEKKLKEDTKNKSNKKVENKDKKRLNSGIELAILTLPLLFLVF